MIETILIMSITISILALAYGIIKAGDDYDDEI